MRLKSIRLAGFKSFAEPTKIPFPRQLTGVVGPNGCGKSNVIDAVRWVLGESSARNLRGDAMTDVIFNGSTRRAAASKASVELAFDNESGRLGGEYGAYNEVAVRREVTRDGQNLYFLNGTRCRKKDITDLFLGTGLGPRSYAIIEQGMISRLIESKPQDLRVFIDEAAGVSRYKERRRETENRIRHTEENLLRLNDIESELTAQVDKLRVQAQAAMRYRQLRDRLRQLQQQQSLAQLRRLDQALDQKNSEESTQNQQLAMLDAKLTELDNQHLLVSEEQRELIEQLDSFRQEQAQSAAQLARCEEQLLFQQANQKQRITREQSYQQRIEQLQQELATRQQQVPQLTAHIDTLEQEFAIGEQQLDELNDTLQQADDAQQQASARKSEADHQSQQLRQQLATRQEQQRGAQHLQQRLQQQLQKLSVQCNEHANLFEDELGELDSQLQQAERQVQQQHTTVLQLSACQKNCQTEVEQKSEHLLKLNQQLFKQRTERQSLQQLLDSLAKQQYVASHPLRERLSITPGWELAVEKVLGPWLFAETDQRKREQADLAIWADVSVPDNEPQNALVHHVQGAPIILLRGVRCVSSKQQALQERDQLAPHQSLITAQGEWFGRDWQNVLGADDHQSILAQQTHLEQLDKQLQTLEPSQQQAEQTLTVAKEQLQQIEAELEIAQQALQTGRAQQAQLTQQVALAQQRHAHQQTQQEVLHAQYQQAQDELQESQAQVDMLAEQLEELQWQFEQQQQQYLNVEQIAQQCTQHHQQLNAQSQQIERNQHQLQLKLQQQHAKLSQISEWVKDRSEQLKQLQAELAELAESAQQGVDLEQLLQQAETLRQLQLEQQVQHEQLEGKRQQYQQQLTQLSLDHKTLQSQKEQQQQLFQQQQLASQELLTRRRVLLEQLAEAGVTLSPQALDEIDMTIDYAAELDALARQIKRIGAVNLAA
ncbi:chromosome segregation protein SMC, partial [Celerinatantimonas yamalensis]